MIKEKIMLKNLMLAVVSAAALLFVFMMGTVKASAEEPDEVITQQEENVVEYVEEGNSEKPLGEKEKLAALPDKPNRFVSQEDLFTYYRMTNKEVGIYDLRSDRIYYMHFQPLDFAAFRQKDYFIIIDKVWEQKRGGLIGWLGDYTKRTIQYTDVVTGEICYSRPLTHELRFFELEKIKNVTDPCIRNQLASQ